MNEENQQDSTENLPVELDGDEKADPQMVEQAAEDSQTSEETLANDRTLDIDRSEIDLSEIILSETDLSEDFVIDELVAEGEAEEAERTGMLLSEESISPENIETSQETVPGTSPTIESEAEESITAASEELMPVIESLLFVADEPLPFKQLCKILGDVSEDDVRAALEELMAAYESRQSGLEIREIAGGWRISTRPQYHEFIRKYLKSRPSARLSLPALETLAVIAYKQPITIPEILEIRGVSSSSAIKTLLEKRLIITKGRKETVGRPMMYGTSKEFMIQFGLKDLSELPSIEDFEDLSQ
jgi:segregation and condensation protein B